MKTKILNLLIIIALSGCAAIEDGRIKPPLVYRLDVQQGNVVDQSMVNKLKVGMDEKQVRFILGTPLLIDPFHPERWEYLYFYRESDNKPEQRHITVYFEDKKLSHLAGDIKVTHLPIQDEPTRTEKSIVVPDEYSEKGLLDRWLKDKPEAEEKSEKTETSEIEEELAEPAKEVLDDDSETEEVIEEATADLEVAREEETAEDDEPGFFSRMWDKITPGNDDDSEGSEVLEPELESK